MSVQRWLVVAMGVGLFVACTQPLPIPKRTDRPLPFYESAKNINGPWLTLDVDTDNVVRYRDKIIYDHSVDDPVVLQRALQSFRSAAIASGDTMLSTLVFDDQVYHAIVDPVRIEGHRWAEWAYVFELMTACSQEDVAFFAVQLALFAE